MEASPPSPNDNELPSVTYNLQDFQMPIVICLLGVMFIILFIQIFDRFHNWLRYGASIDQLDIEWGQVADYQLENSDWSHEATAQNNFWMVEIFNGFMEYLAERQGTGLTPEFLEHASPCVSYKSLRETTLDECVICLEDVEDDELCRVFPVCEHVFHCSCIDNWLRNHLTCPICRNCIIDSISMTLRM
ncbi:hypothetical protein ERO13_A01G064160v2 [Gossypium hirsutum]|uniref:RING-type E3 ubiquitin transferase n=5 Tax=Gossypium TaxID=3633 RepID=A0A1U8KI17_GOSHI|nr:RING-H2 finger protein ATL28-like [Gossypium hirsutum]KAB2095790.1 hypothetical protein ES319_A01G064000v1 [Gossypium barbadense]TYH30145.1 hypothetical protein ES288_A01G070500v1 [Gossypium darwinii]TYI42152.1 hypothetical protein ES332_A01G077600v1 [Gossypium tomentosum]TYJ48495.1 hypothetical protein E1A91_A01G066300v1 [Gossypium mustelinum]KAG4213559.1 hypothetical protein ERO13_A01G064160v2 [Gossypium hirsutum]